MRAPPILMWFSNDLRLHDHEALTWAAARGPVVPLFIYDDTVALGGATKWWLHQALQAFSVDLKSKKLDLILRRGDALTVLRQLVKQSGAKTVCWSQRYEPALAARDAQITQALENDGIEVTQHTGFLLFDPAKITTKSGTFFKVYTPFSKACFKAAAPGKTLPIPRKLAGVPDLQSDQLADWRLLPRRLTWPQGLAASWQADAATGQKKLRGFIDKILHGYHTSRNLPASLGTSRLSPYLHFGHLSPRQIWNAIVHLQGDALSAGGAERYLLELLWREFSWHLLHHLPHLTTEPLYERFAKFPWRKDAKNLRAWQRGQTGYPIVDAGMRELWQTGWMHNRVRMLTASFLVKDLMIDWRTGADWFWDTLVDADLGNNTNSWQWVAGCGADASPYFRIFNPVTQGEKFDPDGAYVRRYVPELAALSDKYIHAPWAAPPEVLKSAHIQLGRTYPRPIVDHDMARQRALEALKKTRSTAKKPHQQAD